MQSKAADARTVRSQSFLTMNPYYVVAVVTVRVTISVVPLVELLAPAPVVLSTAVIVNV